MLPSLPGPSVPPSPRTASAARSGGKQMLLEPRGVLIKKLEFTPDVLHHVELPERSDLIYRISQIILPV